MKIQTGLNSIKCIQKDADVCRVRKLRQESSRLATCANSIQTNTHVTASTSALANWATVVDNFAGNDDSQTVKYPINCSYIS